jgi:hypothetical protein
VLRLHWPWIGSIGAITFGHVVLGYDEAILDISRDHERVHVRQYERWGPLFLPLYVLASAILAVRGLDAYRDNPFEREAYGQSRGRGLTKRWSRLAITSCGMVRLLAASCSTFSFGNRKPRARAAVASRGYWWCCNARS